MQPMEPVQLHHSWPIVERGLRFPLGLLDVAYGRALSGDGAFRCDLRDDRLTWAEPTFALFGLPVGAAPRRDVVLPMYRTESRSALDRLRAHAIRHRRGFTIDTQLDAPGRPPRWIRVIAMPEVEGGRTVRLVGVHRDVSDEYR